MGEKMNFTHLTQWLLQYLHKLHQIFVRVKFLPATLTSLLLGHQDTNSVKISMQKDLSVKKSVLVRREKWLPANLLSFHLSISWDFYGTVWSLTHEIWQIDYPWDLCISVMLFEQSINKENHYDIIVHYYFCVYENHFSYLIFIFKSSSLTR